MNRWEGEQLIILQALKDPKIKKNLFENPEKTVKEILKGKVDSQKLNSLPKIKIEKEKKNEWIIGFPCVEEEVLSEDQLEKIASGAAHCIWSKH